MRRVVLSSVACLTLIIFYHIISNKRDFRLKKLNMKCVFGFSLQLLYETFLILRRIQRDVIKE